MWCIKVNNVISLLTKLPEWWHWLSLLRYVFNMVYKGKYLPCEKWRLLKCDVFGINEWNVFGKDRISCRCFDQEALPSLWLVNRWNWRRGVACDWLWRGNSSFWSKMWHRRQCRSYSLCRENILRVSVVQVGILQICFFLINRTVPTVFF